MQSTLFTATVVHSALGDPSVGFLRLGGWRIVGASPAEARRSVLIAAPPTSIGTCATR